MGRKKGSKNKQTSALPSYAALSTNEKLAALANLMVDRILDDQRNKEVLLKQIVRQDYVRSSST